MIPSAGSIPDPIDDALRKRFEEDEHLRFSCDLNAERILWWERKLGRHNLYPKELGRHLVRGLPFRTTFDVTMIDVEKEHARIEIEAFDDDGRRVMKAGRSVEFDTEQVHLNKISIVKRHRSKLYGRFMLRNAYDLALMLRFGKLGLSAMEFGSYVWAKAGFYPTRKAWLETGDGRFRDTVLRYVERLSEKDVDWQRKADIYEVVNDDDPRAIWAIAGLQGMVESRLEPGERVKLGWALLVESGSTWEGELPFGQDKAAERRLLDYLRELTKAAAS